jgi:hypothetical protein
MEARDKIKKISEPGMMTYSCNSRGNQEAPV